MTGLSRLKKKLADMPSPCDRCSHTEKCAEGYACRAFSNWIQRGHVSDRAAYVPKREIFERIFSQDDFD